MISEQASRNRPAGFVLVAIGDGLGKLLVERQRNVVEDACAPNRIDAALAFPRATALLPITRTSWLGCGVLK
jgi:hypothetical protein